jgi:hypothetical protein
VDFLEKFLDCSVVCGDDLRDIVTLFCRSDCSKIRATVLVLVGWLSEECASEYEKETCISDDICIECVASHLKPLEKRLDIVAQFVERAVKALNSLLPKQRQH